jgi:predicted  nucleic acid-binding Zn-ribbon protein
MEYQLNYLASLSYLDLQHDELQEEYGDLPRKVEEVRIKTDKLKSLVDETKSIIKNNKKFAAEAKVTLVELKTKEEKLAKQQFKVKNNKEFDAITQEIEFVQNEYKRISEELSTNGLKEENLIATLEEQEANYKEAKAEFKDLEKELAEISDDQNDEVKKILKLRNSYVKKLTTENLELYNRIRKYYDDAVVLVKKNSCTGCYSQMPAQKVVEIRTHLDQIYTCEHCGRILYTDDIEIDKKVLDL